MVLEGILATPRPPPLHDTAPEAGSDAKAKSKISEEEARPKKTAIVSNSRRIRTVESYTPLSKTRSDHIISTSNAKPPANVGAPTLVPAQTKKTPSVVASSVVEEEKKMEATKRKLQQRYQEAADAKRRRTIQVIKAPQPPPGTTGQKQRNVHPGVRARAPASCAAGRPFVKSCTLPLRV
ncbi:unnamed protein product [Urochloa humidicola]